MSGGLVWRAASLIGRFWRNGSVTTVLPFSGLSKIHVGLISVTMWVMDAEWRYGKFSAVKLVVVPFVVVVLQTPDTLTMNVWLKTSLG
jgi:hypothetical protein